MATSGGHCVRRSGGRLPGTTEHVPLVPQDNDLSVSSGGKVSPHRFSISLLGFTPAQVLTLLPILTSALVLVPSRASMSSADADICSNFNMSTCARLVLVLVLVLTPMLLLMPVLVPVLRCELASLMMRGVRKLHPLHRQNKCSAPCELPPPLHRLMAAYGANS